MEWAMMPRVSARRGERPARNRGSMSTRACSVREGPTATASMDRHTQAEGKAENRARAAAALAAAGWVALAMVVLGGKVGEYTVAW